MERGRQGGLSQLLLLACAFKQTTNGQPGLDEFHVSIRKRKEFLNVSLDPFTFSFWCFDRFVFWLAQNSSVSFGIDSQLVTAASYYWHRSAVWEREFLPLLKLP